MRRFTIIAMAACVTVSITARASGQAYCALRDPTRRIYEAYPAATNYKSIVRTVDERVRQQVVSELPFTIHFNELGRHTVYLPVQNGRPLGLIHARSERGRWGLVEVVWSLTPTMQVADYSFQRCRGRSRKSIESAAFKGQLIGLGFYELRELLSADGGSLSPGALQVPAGSEEMAAMVVRSALKTICVTRLVWAEDLQVIRPLYQVYLAFPEASRADVVTNPYTETVNTALTNGLRTDESSVDRRFVTVIRVVGAEGNLIGHVVRTPWQSLGQQTVFWWTIRGNAVIEDVVAEDGWPNREIKSAFEATKGLTLSRLESCSSAAEMVGAEVLLLIGHSN